MNYTVTLSEEQEKALLTDMGSIQDWLNNAIHNKARQMVDKICDKALSDQTDTILTSTEKQEIVTLLASQGKIISTVKQMPENIKLEIVKKARIKSAAEREAELKASMEGGG